MGTPAVSPTTVAVAPTETTVATLDVRTTAAVTVQVTNLDASQTFTGQVYRRANSAMAWALASQQTGLSSIDAGATAAIDIDCEGNADIQVTGSMSGAGGDVQICVRDKPR